MTHKKGTSMKTYLIKYTVEYGTYLVISEGRSAQEALEALVERRTEKGPEITFAAATDITNLGNAYGSNAKSRTKFWRRYEIPVLKKVWVEVEPPTIDWSSTP